MKISKLILLTSLFASSLFAQEHFNGISSSKRGGLLNAAHNPAELVNMTTKYEVTLFNFSLAMANDKLTFDDLIKGENLEDKIFEGNGTVNLRLDAQIYGPGFALKTEKWGFGISSMANVKANIINIDTKLADAIQNGELSNLFTQTTIASNENQRLNATTWGELNFNIARNLIDLPKHKVNAGTNLRLLFPGGYANFSADNLNGTIVNNLGNTSLMNTSANINIAYAGALANNFDDQSNYNEFFSQGINGFAVDLGLNYRWKDENDANSYRINAGLSVKNIGLNDF